MAGRGSTGRDVDVVTVVVLGVGCRLSVVGCLLFVVVWCWLFVVCCLLVCWFVGLLFVVCCLLLLLFFFFFFSVPQTDARSRQGDSLVFSSEGHFSMFFCLYLYLPSIEPNVPTGIAEASDRCGAQLLASNTQCLSEVAVCYKDYQ